MNVRYGILFSVEILNDYFSSGKWKEITFLPLPETEKLIGSGGFRVIKVHNQLLVVTRVDIDMKPLRLPDLFTGFSFVLQPQTPNYINFSNLPFRESRLKSLHFHNLQNNTSGGVNYLSSAIVNYSPAITYKPGEFCLGSDGSVYESIKINNNIQAPDDTDTGSKEYWVKHGDIQFVSERDTIATDADESFEIKKTGPVFNFKASVKRTVHNVNVYSYNFSTGTYSKEVYHDIIRFGNPHDIVQVDMRSLSSGLYRIRVENEVNFVYMVSSGNDPDSPFFLEIFNLPPSDPRSLVRPDGTLKNIKYTIHFASRRVFWRYRTRTTVIDNIKDSAGEFKFKPDGPRFFISETPIPFSDTPRKTFSADSGNLVITSPLPNPMADRLLNKRDEIFTTEISVNS